MIQPDGRQNVSVPCFSVILPTHNRLRMLQDAIKSVRGQTFTDYELIVVDDGSTDGTADYLTAYKDEIKMIRQPQRGPGAARNAGLAAASGSYIAFLDSDDAWFPWTLQVYRQAIQQHEQPAFLTGAALPWAEAGTASVSEPMTTLFPDLLHACGGDMPPVSGTPSICLRTDVLRASGGFAAQNMNAEDVVLWLRLGTAAGFVQIHSPPVFAQRKHEGNVSLAVAASILGARHLVTQERAGIYPGGGQFQRGRRRIIAANARSVILSALRQGMVQDAWGLFCGTFLWQFQFRHFRFLAAFPFLCLRACIHP